MTTATPEDWDRWQRTLALAEEQRTRCLVIPGSKRTCEKGTDGCGIAHRPLPLIDLADHRAAMVRAVVARDWAAACICQARALPDIDDDFSHEMGGSIFSGTAAEIADLPSADDFVAAILGESR